MKPNIHEFLEQFMDGGQSLKDWLPRPHEHWYSARRIISKYTRGYEYKIEVEWTASMTSWQAQQVVIYDCRPQYRAPSLNRWTVTTTTNVWESPSNYTHGGDQEVFRSGMTGVEYPLIDTLSAGMPGKPAAGALRLWRCWNVTAPFTWRSYFNPTPQQIVTETRLFSTATPHEWKWHYGTSHVPPSKEIEHAGFHGFYNFADVNSKFKQDAVQTCIIGAFLGWGRSVKHRYGARTQYAQIDCILATEMASLFPKGTPGIYAKKFDVPLVTYGQAAEMSRTVTDFTVDKIRKTDEEIAGEIFG